MIDLYNDDCLNVLKNISDGSIDLVVTDPPYEFQSDGGGCFGSNIKQYHHELRDAEITRGFNIEILTELKRIMKIPNIYIWCNKDQIKKYLNFFDDCNMDLLSWHKTNPVPTCNNKYLSDTEYCLFFRGRGAKVYGNYGSKHKYWVSPINKADKQLYNHPTVKPLDIIKTLITNSSSEGDVVCDPFMGSGTTGVACKELHRKFIGIEINKDYFNTAKKRIDDIEVQPELF